MRFFLGGLAEIASGANRPPEGDRWTMWIGGVFFAFAVGVAGILSILTSHGVAGGVVLVFVGLIFHFHYFWGLHPKLSGLTVFGKNAAALGAICGIAYGVYRFIANL